MYPLQFRPNTLCHTYDTNGTLIKAAAQIQLFRPMLGLEFNGLPANWDKQTEPGACILRFAVADSGFAHQVVGPTRWQQTDMPYFTLNEDPSAEKWYVTDGVCWSASPDDILSGFASKKLPNQDASVYTALGTGGPSASLLNRRLEFGRVYRRSFLAGNSEWFNLYPQAMNQYAYQTLSETIPGPAYVTVKGFDGTVQNPSNRWTTGGGASVFVGSVATTLVQGPVVYVQFNNTTGVDSDTTFVITRWLAQARKV